MISSDSNRAPEAPGDDKKESPAGEGPAAPDRGSDAARWRLAVPAIMWTAAALWFYSLGLDVPTTVTLMWLTGLGLILAGSAFLNHRDQALRRSLGGLGRAEARAELLERRLERRGADLRLRQRQLQALMDHLQPGVYIKNAHHEFVLINSRLAEMMEAPPDQLPGSTGLQFLKPSAAWKIMEAEQEAARERRPAEIPDLFDDSERPDGRLVSLYIFPLENPDGGLEGTGGLLTDLSDQRRRDRELAEAKEAAQKASTAKRSFLANISHEIRSPLNGIIGMADLLARSRLTDDQAAMAAVIKNAGDTLLTALNDVLDLSKIETGRMCLEPKTFSLRELMFDAVRGLAPIARSKSLDLVVNIDPRLPDLLFGDDLRLRQILSNLVSNALKFTNQGQVKIFAGLRPPSPPSPAALRPGPVPPAEPQAAGITIGEAARPLEERRVNLKLSVSDTGIGIPESKRKIIFEAFELADTSITRNYGGVGLGLAISSRLAAMMNSRLNLESRRNLGSTFWLDLELPVVAETSALSPRVHYESFQGHRLLYADEDPTGQREMTEALAGLNIPLSLAGSADEALADLRAAAGEGRPFNLLMTAAGLKLAGGRLLTEALKSDSALSEMSVLTVAPAGSPPAPEVLVRPLVPQRLARLLASILGVWERLDYTDLAEGLTAEVARTSSRRLKILLTEDMEVNQIVARRMLTEMGHQVVVAANGAEALKLFRSNDFDLILMDIQMPVMDGLAAAARIKNLEKELGRPHTPVVAVTAHALKGDRERYLRQGMDDYLSKPLTMADLGRMIETMIVRWNIEGRAEPAAEPDPRPGPAEAPVFPSPPAGREEPADRPEAARLLDPETVKLSFGDNRTLLLKSLELYRRDAPALMDKISAALEEQQVGQAAAEAHALKGISGYYSRRGPFQLAQELDQLARRADWPADRQALTALAADLRAAVNELVAEMENYMKSQS